MRGVYIEAGTLQVRDDLPIPTPEPGEALVRVHLAGLCATDIELLRGYVSGFQGIPGHEFVGTIEAIYPLMEAKEAFAHARRRGALKILLNIIP
ncbi:MAG: alcohol dehydrogenase catalytic domain-containing protein [Anaerolineae bacterium]